MTADRYAWMADALCAQADPDAWQPDGKGAKYVQAKAICERCPVQADCDAHADNLHAYDGLAMNGMWAGRSKKQRHDQRRMGEAA